MIGLEVLMTLEWRCEKSEPWGNRNPRDQKGLSFDLPIEAILNFGENRSKPTVF
jgi:hypothetical protein